MLQSRFVALLLVGLLTLLAPTEGQRMLKEKDADVDTPSECLELKGKDFDECMGEWPAANVAAKEANNYVDVKDYTGNNSDVLGDDGSEFPGDESNNGDVTVNNMNDNETDQQSIVVDDIVYVKIGKHDTSLTIYSSPDKINEFDTDGEYSSFVRQYELDAITDHLRSVYQERYNKRVIALKINLASGGKTEISESIIFHSTFDGTVAFDDNSEPELESETLFAFKGNQKQKFLQIFHDLYAEDNNHKVVDVTTLYDMAVKKSSNDDGSIAGGTHEAASGDSSAGSDNTMLIVFTIMSVVLTVITVSVNAVFIRRFIRPQQGSKSNLKYPVIDELEKFDDEEGQNQYGDMGVIPSLDGSSTANIEEKSFEEQSSLSSGEGRKSFEKPFPMVTSSHLNSVEEEFMRLDSDVSGVQNDNWSFKDVGEDDTSNSSPEGGSSMANESYGTSLGGASELFRNVMKYDEAIMPNQTISDMPEEKKGEFMDDRSSSFQGDISELEDEHYGDGDSYVGEIHDGSSSFLGYTNGLDDKHDGDGDSFTLSSIIDV